MRWSRAMAVFRFEMKRTITAPRVVGWAILAMFPVLIVATMRIQLEVQQATLPSDSVWGIVLFELIPEVICLLGLLLWATPVVYSEVEARSWTYVAVRPGGRSAVLLGKYLVAIVWTQCAAWVAVTCSVAIAQPQQAFRLWLSLMVLSTLSCLAYGSLYCLIGVLFPRRAMVIAVAYTLILEFLVSLIPAMINQLTIHFRLRSLMISWMDWWDEIPDEMVFYVGKHPAWQHLTVLAAVIVVLGLIADWLIRHREYVTADDA